MFVYLFPQDSLFYGQFDTNDTVFIYKGSLGQLHSFCSFNVSHQNYNSSVLQSSVLLSKLTKCLQRSFGGTCRPGDIRRGPVRPPLIESEPCSLRSRCQEILT